MEDISYDWVILPEIQTISSGSGKIIVQDQSTNNTSGLDLTTSPTTFPIDKYPQGLHSKSDKSKKSRINHRFWIIGGVVIGTTLCIAVKKLGFLKNNW